VRILIIDDHDAFARVVIQQFLAAHHVVLVASIAGARAELAAGSFDAVLVDDEFVDGGGEALVSELSRLRPELRLVGISARAEGNARLRAAGAHAACEKRDFARIGEVLASLTT
jgi:DNA-binding NtrC family response regulator